VALRSETSADPANYTGPLTLWRILIIALCVLLNICDGLDTAATGLAAPLLIKHAGWSFKEAGLLLSANSVGLVLGALVVAPLADRVGRRPMVLACIWGSAIAMLAIAFGPPFALLLILRVVTGTTIGAAIPSLTVTAVEVAGGARGNLALACVHLGFAGGAAIAAVVGASAARAGDWQYIFLVAGAITAGVAILATIFFPESPSYLIARRPVGALNRVNRIRRRYGDAPLDEMPPQIMPDSKAPIALNRLLGHGYLATTLLLWFACFARFCVSYFLASWRSTMLVSAGMSVAAANLSGLASSLSSALGVLTMGAISTLMPPARLTCIAFFFCSVTLLCFGLVHDPFWMIVTSSINQFTVEMTFTGVIICAARFYPADIRLTGVAWVTGVGRIGAIVGPYTGGVLMSMAIDRGHYVAIYAALAMLGAVAVGVVAKMNRPMAAA